VGDDEAEDDEVDAEGEDLASLAGLDGVEEHAAEGDPGAALAAEVSSTAIQTRPGARGGRGA